MNLFPPQMGLHIQQFIAGISDFGEDVAHAFGDGRGHGVFRSRFLDT